MKKEDLKAITELLTPIHDHLDKMDTRLDKVEKRLSTVDSRLNKVDSRLDKIDDRLEFMEHNQSHIVNKLENLRLDVVVAERDTRRDIYDLKNEMETVIEIIKMRKLLPDVKI